MVETVGLPGGAGAFALPEDTPEPGVLLIGDAGASAERVAAEGYVALHIDPEVELAAAVGFLTGRPECTGRVGVLGPGAAVAAALGRDDVAAVVAFGPLPAVPVGQSVAVLVHRAAEHAAAGPDEVAALRRVVAAAGGTLTLHDYPGTRGGFHDEHHPVAFDEMQADEAWGRTFDFLAAALRP